MTLIDDPPPVPPANDGRRYDWPRYEKRHLIATLPETSMGRWHNRTGAAR